MFLLGFFVFSCEKQVIVPNDNSHSPTMRSCRGGGQILNGDDSNGGSVNNSITDPDDKDKVVNGVIITDPDDKDKDKGGKKNH